MKEKEKERPHFDINEQGEDWADWVPIPLKPEWLNEQIMKECRDKYIPVTIMRIRDKQGKEWLRLFRKSPLSKMEWIT